MKKITIELPDVDVHVIKFVDRDAYESFSGLEGRVVENVNSEFEEIEKIRKSKPVAFVKQSDNTYLIVTKKTDVLIS